MYKRQIPLLQENCEKRGIDIVLNTTVDTILTDANAAQNDDLTLNLTVTDENEQFYVTRKNGVLLTYPGENRPDAQASVTCRRLQLFALMTGQQAGQVQITGDATVLKRLLAYASKFEKTFNVIEP